MLGLLKPALMPIQGSVWSCVRLQQDQSRVMPLWGAAHRREGWKVLTRPQRSALGQSVDKKTLKCVDSILFYPYSKSHLPLGRMFKMTSSHFQLAST